MTPADLIAALCALVLVLVFYAAWVDRKRRGRE